MFNIKFLKKIIFYIALSFIVNYNQLLADTQKFDIWLNKFKLIALENGISQKTIDNVLTNVIFQDRVLVYDNRQPEFFEKLMII